MKIYTKQDCNWCLLLKGLLRERNILFAEVELKGDEIPTFFQMKSFDLRSKISQIRAPK